MCVLSNIEGLYPKLSWLLETSCEANYLSWTMASVAKMTVNALKLMQNKNSFSWKKIKFCCLSRNCYCKGLSYKVVFPCQGPTQCNPWLQVGVQDWCSSDSSLEYPHRSLHHMLTMVTTCYIHRQLEDEQMELLCYCCFHIPRIPRIIYLIKTSCVGLSIVARKNIHLLVWPYWHSFFFLTKNKTSHLILPLFTGSTQVSRHLDKLML